MEKRQCEYHRVALDIREEPPRYPRRILDGVCRKKCKTPTAFIHLVVDQVADLTAEMKCISGLDAAFPAENGARGRSQVWWQRL
ncbi:hypothetical protein [Bradyrhizobium sp. JR3.5]